MLSVEFLQFLDAILRYPTGDFVTQLSVIHRKSIIISKMCIVKSDKSDVNITFSLMMLLHVIPKCFSIMPWNHAICFSR